jgi:hypothetical protein
MDEYRSHNVNYSQSDLRKVNTIQAILPAAGNAVRLRGLPKFLLPMDTNALTLLEKHIELLNFHAEVIWLPVRADLASLVTDLNLGEKVIPIPVRTKTMTETVLRIVELTEVNEFILGMPDTVFSHGNPYEKLISVRNKSEADLVLSIWNTRVEQQGKVGSVKFDKNYKVLESKDKILDRSYSHHWGAMYMNKRFIDLLNKEMPHPGYAINLAVAENLRNFVSLEEGEYFDCGTFDEYQKYLIGRAE